MIVAVVDTNVLVSGIVGLIAASDRPPARILRLLQVKRFEMVLSEHIIAEVRRTQEKPYFRKTLPASKAAEARISLAHEARLVPISVLVSGVATHAEDDVVLATAVSAGADYLVTGDVALLRLGVYQGVTLISPRRFVELHEAEQDDFDAEPSPELD